MTGYNGPRWGRVIGEEEAKRSESHYTIPQIQLNCPLKYHLEQSSAITKLHENWTWIGDNSTANTTSPFESIKSASHMVVNQNVALLLEWRESNSYVISQLSLNYTSWPGQNRFRFTWSIITIYPSIGGRYYESTVYCTDHRAYIVW